MKRKRNPDLELRKMWNAQAKRKAIQPRLVVVDGAGGVMIHPDDRTKGKGKCG